MRGDDETQTDPQKQPLAMRRVFEFDDDDEPCEPIQFEQTPSDLRAELSAVRQQRDNVLAENTELCAVAEAAQRVANDMLRIAGHASAAAVAAEDALTNIFMHVTPVELALGNIAHQVDTTRCNDPEGRGCVGHGLVFRDAACKLLAALGAVVGNEK